jgi:hypothetical protein
MIIHINILVHAVFQQIAAGDHAHTLESQLGVQLDRTVIALDNGIEDHNIETGTFYRSEEPVERYAFSSEWRTSPSPIFMPRIFEETA